eukprot:COSAG06_NODE_61373_length_268_cov_0.544379_1_plen_40_part_01
MGRMLGCLPTPAHPPTRRVPGFGGVEEGSNGGQTVSSDDS